MTILCVANNISCNVIIENKRANLNWLGGGDLGRWAIHLSHSKWVVYAVRENKLVHGLLEFDTRNCRDFVCDAYSWKKAMKHRRNDKIWDDLRWLTRGLSKAVCPRINYTWLLLNRLCHRNLSECAGRPTTRHATATRRRTLRRLTTNHEPMSHGHVLTPSPNNAERRY